jgi:acetyl/propionyl-CoA carboxylase alpha subunit/acetyl-CoA carboxylase carboxyltransferase component
MTGTERAISKLLIANRGEVAVRIARTATDMGLATVGVFTADDALALHTRRVDTAVVLPKAGASGYLDGTAMVSTALAQGCDAVHPGWGFRSEDARFAQQVEDAGLVFVGPTVAQLGKLGDKLSALALAEQAGVPVLPTSAALTDADEIQAFRDTHDIETVMLKAAGGGGGRGMRIVRKCDDAAQLLNQCQQEAQAAFGNNSVYAERCVEHARHIEVQVVGDGNGGVTHLWERECTLQRQQQKLLEVAPAPNLEATVRRHLLASACGIAERLHYRGLGTFEFLVDMDSGAFFFIEANARLQVEHTVTEAVTGLDLVQIQLAIAAGASLAESGLDAPPETHGFAIQTRINAETMSAGGTFAASSGTLTRFDMPGGPGVRVDTAAHAGARLNPAYDSMLAKVIVHSRGTDFAKAVRRSARALAETTITGADTNLGLMRALLERDDIARGTWSTRYVEQHLAALVERAAEVVVAIHHEAPAVPHPRTAIARVPPGAQAVLAPMRASVIETHVCDGETVTRGQTLVTLEAMKMHHLVAAPASGVVHTLCAQLGDTLDEGDLIAAIEVDTGRADDISEEAAINLDAPRADLEEVRERHALGLDANRPQSVQKRRKINSRTARENIDALCDADSFIEYGALAIAAQRRRRSIDDLMHKTPADGMVAGMATVNADAFGAETARCAVAAYDYTVLAGTQGYVNHKKKDRLFELAEQWAMPFVFFTEGGGGRPGDVDIDDVTMGWLDLMTFTTWPKISGAAPRIAVNSGRCFAGNAVVFGCADITVATRNSNIGLAGPAMIEGGGLGKFTPEDIGPIDVQTANGVIDVATEDEVEATAVTRQLLGYFQGCIQQWTSTDQRVLRHLVPENRLRVYDVRQIIHALADTDSVVELRPHYGVGLITAFIRIEGRPFGLIANDARHLGGALDGDGSEKGARFLQLCDTYGVPIVSLCDTPGFMVGPDSEKTAAVRRGSRLIIAAANLKVPLMTIVLRKAYGLGAQAMAGGSFHRPLLAVAWPTSEFGPMGLEGAVELGFRKELEATPTPEARDALFHELVGRMYEKGKGISVAQTFEIDAVIDPADTRRWLVKGLNAAGPISRSKRQYVDVW